MNSIIIGSEVAKTASTISSVIPAASAISSTVSGSSKISKFAIGGGIAAAAALAIGGLVAFKVIRNKKAEKPEVEAEVEQAETISEEKSAAERVDEMIDIETKRIEENIAEGETELEALQIKQAEIAKKLAAAKDSKEEDDENTKNLFEQLGNLVVDSHLNLNGESAPQAAQRYLNSYISQLENSIQTAKEMGIPSTLLEQALAQSKAEMLLGIISVIDTFGIGTSTDKPQDNMVDMLAAENAKLAADYEAQHVVIVNLQNERDEARAALEKLSSIAKSEVSSSDDEEGDEPVPGTVDSDGFIITKPFDRQPWRTYGSRENVSLVNELRTALKTMTFPKETPTGDFQDDPDMVEVANIRNACREIMGIRIHIFAQDAPALQFALKKTVINQMDIIYRCSGADDASIIAGTLNLLKILPNYCQADDNVAFNELKETIVNWSSEGTEARYTLDDNLFRHAISEDIRGRHKVNDVIEVTMEKLGLKVKK